MIATNIGKFTLTENQIKNWAVFGVWERFSYIDNEVIGGSISDPSKSDIDLFVNSIKSLPDSVPAKEQQEQAIEKKKDDDVKNANDFASLKQAVINYLGIK